MDNHFTKAITYNSLLENVAKLIDIDNDPKYSYDRNHLSQFSDDVMNLANLKQELISDFNSTRNLTKEEKPKSGVEKSVYKYIKKVKKWYKYYTKYDIFAKDVESKNKKFLASTEKAVLSATNEELKEYFGSLFAGYNEVMSVNKNIKVLSEGSHILTVEQFAKFMTENIDDFKKLNSNGIVEYLITNIIEPKITNITEAKALDYRWVSQITLDKVNRETVIEYTKNSYKTLNVLKNRNDGFFNYLDKKYLEVKNANNNSRKINKIMDEVSLVVSYYGFYMRINEILTYYFNWNSIILLYLIAGNGTNPPVYK